MSANVFIELCYSEYVSEREEVNHIYHRSGALITAIALSSAALFAVSPSGLPEDLGHRFDETLHILLVTAGTLLLICSAVFVALALRPRPMMRLTTMKHYRDWREAYRQQLLASGYEHRYTDDTVDRYTRHAVEEALVQAHDECAKENRSRQAHFKKAFWSFFLALAVIAAAGAMNVWDNASNVKESPDVREAAQPTATAAAAGT